MTGPQAIKLLIEMKKIVPGYVRVKRVSRDISEKIAVSGPKTTNLRQLAHKKMRELGIGCSCIRCREVRNKPLGKVSLKRIDYDASGGKEIFLSYEDLKNDILIAFLRLRIGEAARVRELHVYGPMAGIGKKGRVQHKGYGKKLLREAECISKSLGIKEIKVTSGVGVRDYYRKLGYKLEGSYMAKVI